MQQNPLIPADQGRARPTTLYALFGSLVSLLLGYDLGIIASALEHVKEYFNLGDGELELLVGLFGVVAACAAPAAAILSDMIGRRSSIAISAAVATVGSIMMATATSYGLLLAGRIVTGLGVGGGLAGAPTYLSELAPSGDRGQIVCLLELFVNVGIFAGFLAGKLSSGLGTPTNFRVMFGMAAVPAALLVIVLPTMPESPRWLVMKGRKEEARAALLATLGTEEAEETLVKIEEETQDEGPGLLSEMRAPWFLKSFGIAMGIALFFGWTGIDAVTYYSSLTLEGAGLKDEDLRETCLVAMGLVKTLAVVIAFVLFDRMGRRPLLMASLAGMCLSNLTCVVPGIFIESWHLTLTGLCLFAGSFSIGLGPGFYLISAEIWPTKHRAAGVSVAAFAKAFHGSAVQLGFLSCAQKFGFAPTMSVFGIFAFFGTFFVYFLIPETRGHTLEQIMAEDGPRASQRSLNDQTQNPEDVSSACASTDGPESQHPIAQA